jgi:hypothetical protein
MYDEMDWNPTNIFLLLRLVVCRLVVSADSFLKEKIKASIT